MKTSSRILLGSLIAGVALAAALSIHAATDSAPAGTADSPRARPLAGFMLRRAVHQLDLTADQRMQAKAILKKYQPDLSPEVDQVLAARKALRTAIRALPYDAAAVEAATDKVQAAQKQVILETARMRSELRQVLTPKQLDQIDQWDAKIDERITDARAVFTDWLARS